MRLCRFERGGEVRIGIYDERGIIGLAQAADIYRKTAGQSLDLPPSSDLLDFLPPAGAGWPGARRLAEWVAAEGSRAVAGAALDPDAIQLRVPVPHPNKIFLLAGNYAQHVEEGGEKAAARSETFPYIFMKPPTTTLTDPGRPVRIPKVSPEHIDWEVELGVVIGQRCKHVREADALSVVAGYTVMNDISNRKFRPNPSRRQREQDGFFDWLHGKWADSFCPSGPCVTSADAIPDPQALALQLRLNGQIRQDANTAQMIFPVAALIEFLTSFVTLEPGDIISTGTPAGVGSSTGTYLRPGDRLEAFISSIGTLISPVEAES